MRRAKTGVLQGSGLSPLFFMVYFMRGVYSIRSCEECKSDMSLTPRSRRERCRTCGRVIAYADDCSGIHRILGGAEDNRRKIENQGSMHLRFYLLKSHHLMK